MRCTQGFQRRSGVMAAAILTIGVVHAQKREAHEWLTWGIDTERSNWNREETRLSPATVGKLTLKWKATVDQEVPIEIESANAMLTAPLVVRNVRTPQGTKTLVYTLAASNTLAAVDTATGTIVWRRKFENTVAPVNPANWVCSNTSTATPVIDKAAGLLYFISADGRLHGVDPGSGQGRFLPLEFVPPYSRNWSLNLVDGVIYTTVGRGCGNAPIGEDARRQGYVPPGAAPPVATAPAGNATPAAPPRPPAVASHMIAMDLKDKKVTRFFTSGSRPGGAWSRAGLAYGFGSFFVQTADGAWEPQKGPVGADPAPPVGEDAAGARTTSRRPTSRRSTARISTLRRAARSPSRTTAASWCSPPARTAPSTCTTRNRSAAPITAPRSSRSRRATTR